MVEATLTRDGTTVALPLLDEGAGSPLVARDFGKPEAGPASELGSVDPRWMDQWSQLHQFTLVGRFVGADAYADAIALADLVKSHSNGEAISLDVDLPEFGDAGPIDVAPAPEQSRGATITYPAGWTNVVEVELSLTRVEQALGGGGPTAETPTATGSGPVTLSSPDGSDTVTFTAGLEVERTVGRPNTELQRSTGTYPNYIDNAAAAHDELEIAAEITTDAAATVETLTEMVGRPLGREALTLDFGGKYGLGAMDVVPEGSDAVRTVRQSAEQGTVVVPSMTFRKVTI